MNASGRVAERELGAARGAEQVGDERKVRALDVGEQQRRPAGGDHAAMNLGGFEIRIDRRGDLDEIAVAAQLIEERSQVGEHRLPAQDAWIVHDGAADNREHAGYAGQPSVRHGEDVFGEHGQVGKRARAEPAFVALRFLCVGTAPGHGADGLVTRRRRPPAPPIAPTAAAIVSVGDDTRPAEPRDTTTPWSM